MEQQKIESPMPAKFFFSLVKITGYVIMALELYPLPLTPSPPPTPAHHQVILMGQPLIESSFCHEKKVNVDRLLWMVFPLSYCHLSSFIHLHILQWWKKSHRLEISAVKFTKGHLEFSPLASQHNQYLSLPFLLYLSPALYNCSR